MNNMLAALALLAVSAAPALAEPPDPVQDLRPRSLAHYIVHSNNFAENTLRDLYACYRRDRALGGILGDGCTKFCLGNQSIRVYIPRQDYDPVAVFNGFEAALTQAVACYDARDQARDGIDENVDIPEPAACSSL